MMNNRIMKNLFPLLALGLFTAFPLTAQEKQVEGVGLEFRMVKEIPTTPVKAQSSTSTCWCFASTSFIETEAIRMGKGTHNLSEMFTVYHTYLGKANRYARLHRYGIANFPPGGALNDVPDMMDLYGCVPEEVYDGLEYGSETHNHRELHSVLSTYIEDISTRREYNSRSKSWQDAAYVSPMWEKGFSGLLDAWLGKRPASFTYKGKTYTPESFARSLGFDRDNYVLLSSFNHVPFYREFVIEVPDNWSQGKAWNLPVEEFQEVIRHAVMEGYSVAWASDMRDQYTASKEGIWMLPDAKGVENMSNEEKAAFYKTPTPQKKVTQEMRQKGYDTFITTDDHAMHIVGFAEDQDGNPYYWVKNSWGLQGPFEGYQYASESFVVYKSTSIMVHKDALPEDIRNKLGL